VQNAKPSDFSKITGEIIDNLGYSVDFLKSSTKAMIH
jgi:hypothetical protein